MPYFYRNNIKYSGGSDSVDLTMAEYKELEVNGKVVQDTTYYIIDADENIPSRPNLLINSNFANPVNQRSITAETWLPLSSGSPAYGLDRWKTGATVLSIDGGLTVKKNNGSNGHYFVQIVEGNNIQADKKYTLSACVDGTVLSGTVIASSDTVTFFETDTIKAIFQYVSGDYYCNFILNDDDEHTITWAKLELGEVATPYVPRLYAEELQLCKRYYQQIMLMLPIISQITANNYTRVNYTFPVTMRAKGTIAKSSIKNSASADVGGTISETYHDGGSMMWLRYTATLPTDLYLLDMCLDSEL